MRRWLVAFFFLLISAAALADHKRPKIKGQKPLSTQQGKPITIKLSDLIVEVNENHGNDDEDDDDDDDEDDEGGNDSDYPTGYFVVVYPGKDYSFSGATVTPDSDFTGKLKVDIRVSNGDERSNKFGLVIDVTPAGSGNEQPVITGQHPASIASGSTFTIGFQHLIVADGDNDYPGGFTLHLYPGTGYTLNGKNVVPVPAFSGALKVPVRVHDGTDFSNVFQFTISVAAATPNIKPVITGQRSLSINKNTSITLSLGDLTVADPDNQYPEDFTLTVREGDNYSLSSLRITPATGFVGTLRAGVTVNDGHTSSDVYMLSIQVNEEPKVRITGQKSLVVMEDSSLVLKLTDLIVNDPLNEYPAGFSLQISPGANFQFSGGKVIPQKNFFGKLSVPVHVTNGRHTSEKFMATVTVSPVNDPPSLVMDGQPIVFSKDKSPMQVAPNVAISDPDDQHLVFAEVGFLMDQYQRGNDKLTFAATDQLQAVFNEQTGALFFIGRAPLDVYQKAIASIAYNFTSSFDTIPSASSKVIYFKVNDGRANSEIVEREIVMMHDLSLMIPTGFTPNNDSANDTWNISSLDQQDSEQEVLIRVFTKHGRMVFEGRGFEQQWDGSWNGDLLPADTYYYTIEINAAFRKVRLKGIVTLLR